MRHHVRRRLKRKFGAPWPVALHCDAPDPKPGETIGQYTERTGEAPMPLGERKRRAPYCLVCGTMGRMTPTRWGYRCDGRGDMWGRDGCGNTLDRRFHAIPAPGLIRGTVHATIGLSGGEAAS